MRKTKPIGKSEATKKLIFETALKLFQKKGFEKTTMRDIAKASGLATGAAYYYFETKEEIVMYLYAQTQSDAYNSNVENCAKTNDLKSRVRFIVEYKIDQFVPHRKFVHILAKSAGDPKNSLSPFSHETNRIREEAILLFRNALENSNTSIPEDLLPVMPKLFWLYQLGILFYWTYDESARQKNTKILIDYSLSIIFYLIRFSRLPIFRPVRKSILNVLNELGFGHGKNQGH